MTTIRIGAEERPLRDADQHWIAQQINGRRHDGQSVCVLVTVNAPEVDIRLATPVCGAGGGGSRAFTRREQAIIELWGKCGLSERDFSAGNVISFVEQLTRLLR